MLENVIKSGFFSKEILIVISKFDLFLEENNLTFTEIINENHNTFTNPITGEKYNQSFMDLYIKSIEMTLNAIEKVNNYLYSNDSFEKLNNVFTDLSYNTGVTCSIDKKMIYVRKNPRF